MSVPERDGVRRRVRFRGYGDWYKRQGHCVRVCVGVERELLQHGWWQRGLCVRVCVRVERELLVRVRVRVSTCRT